MKSIQTLIAIIIAALYLVMGYKALASPPAITGVFGLDELPAAMKNEVSAIYGGFGIAFGLCLLVAHFKSGSVAAGVILALGILTLGMAAGRMVSFCFVQPDNRFPMLFMCMELVMGGLMVGLFLVRTRQLA